MIRTIRTTYRKHTSTKRGYYKCSCGKRFTRQVSDFYTMNPFNIKSPKECHTKCIEYINKELSEKECPACLEHVKVTRTVSI